MIYKTNRKKNDLFHNLKELEFRKLMKICTKEAHFRFGGLYFGQIDGVAMGSPLAPTLANLYMSHYENNQLKHLGIVMLTIILYF